MPVYNDNLEVPSGRHNATREHPRPPGKQNYHEGKAAVATVWHAIYLPAIGAAIVSPIVSRATEFAARNGGYAS